MGDTQATKNSEPPRVKQKAEDRPPHQREYAPRGYIDAVLLRSAAGDTPSASPANLSHIFRRFNSSHRTNFLLNTQRHYGNVYVQRMVAQLERNQAQPGQSAQSGGIAPVEETSTSAESLIPPGNGMPLPPDHRVPFEHALGYPLNHVRIHTGPTEHHAARRIQAEAFTAGSDIYFANGVYAPGTTSGDRVLAHELTHVVQNDDGRVPHISSREATISEPTDPLEQEAYQREDAIAETMSKLRSVAEAPSGSGREQGVSASTPQALQPKLTVNQPGHLHKQQADRVAERVTRMPEPTIHRACASCAAGGTTCPTCKSEEDHKGLVQRKTADVALTATHSAPDNFLHHLGPGQPIDTGTGSFSEPHFGRDLSHGHISEDAPTPESVRSINGKTSPLGHDQNDKSLVSRVSSREKTISAPTDPLEREAYAQEETIAQRVTALHSGNPPAVQAPPSPTPVSTSTIEGHQPAQLMPILRKVGAPDSRAMSSLAESDLPGTVSSPTTTSSSSSVPTSPAVEPATPETDASEAIAPFAEAAPPTAASLTTTTSSSTAAPTASATPSGTAPPASLPAIEPDSSIEEVQAQSEAVVASAIQDPAQNTQEGRTASTVSATHVKESAAGQQAALTAQAQSLAVPRAAPTFPAANNVLQSGKAGKPGERPLSPNQLQQFLGSIASASSSSIQAIQAQTEATRASLLVGAEELRQTVQAAVAQEVATLQAAFEAERGALGTSFASAHAQIDSALLAGQADVGTHGEGAKERLAELFAQYRGDVEGAVQDKVAAGEAMRTQYATDVHDRTEAQANEALERGHAKAASYPSDERGQVQSHAAIGVAERTSREIQSRAPAAVNAIEEAVGEIPEQFQEKGQEALQGFDDGLPDLLANIDQQVQAVTEQLDAQAQQAHQQLDDLESQSTANVDSLEGASIAHVEALGPQADAQIDSGLSVGLAFIDASVTQATDQISQAAEVGMTTLQSIEKPDRKASAQLTQQVLSYITGQKEQMISALQQADGAILDKLGQIETDSNEGLSNIDQQTTDSLQALDQTSNSALSQIMDGLEQSFTQTIDNMEQSFTSVESQVQDQLSQALQGLTTSFDQTLGQAEGQIIQAVDASLAKNDEALGQLDGSMQEAAEDAGWDYDHPILSTLRDIGEFVAGAIVGILAVVVVVLAVIALAEVLVAGLVALGLSAAVAELVVLIAGLAVMGYMAYEAYEARSHAGQGGLEAFVGALGDVTGITQIYRSVTAEGLSPFERGKMFGEGVATLVALILPFAKGGGGEAAAEAGEIAGLSESGLLAEGGVPVEPTPGVATPVEPIPTEAPATPTAAEPVPTEGAPVPESPVAPETTPTPEPVTPEATTPTTEAPTTEQPAPTEPTTPKQGEPSLSPEEADLFEGARNKDTSERTPEEVQAEVDVAERTKPREINEPPFIEEVELPDGHKMKRTDDGTWCRFSVGGCFDAEGNPVEMPEATVAETTAPETTPSQEPISSETAPTVEELPVTEGEVQTRINEFREKYGDSVSDPEAMEDALMQIENIARDDPAKASEILDAYAEQLGEQASGDVGHIEVDPGNENLRNLPEYQESVAKASEIFERLPDIENKKNIASGVEGEPGTSGWGDGKIEATERAKAEGIEAGHETEPHFRDPKNAEGQYESSHSERQRAAGTSDQHFASSKRLCPACQRWFSARAGLEGRPQFVSDPSGVHVFSPQGSHWVEPHPSGAVTMP